MRKSAQLGPDSLANELRCLWRLHYRIEATTSSSAAEATTLSVLLNLLTSIKISTLAQLSLLLLCATKLANVELTRLPIQLLLCACAINANNVDGVEKSIQNHKRYKNLMRQMSS
jgi:hypothetical protein